MLVLPLKSTERYNLKEALSRWLDTPPPPSSSSSSSAGAGPRPKFRSRAVLKDFTRLESVRNCLADAITRSNAHKHALDDFALRDCHEYHAALLEFERRHFPTTDSAASGLQLTWSASVGPQRETHGSLVWDRACTLWNIASLESFLGWQSMAAAAKTSEDDDDDDKVDDKTAKKKKDEHREAAKHFQNAASALTYCQDACAQGGGDGAFETVDFSKQSFAFWKAAMVGLAQVNAYELARTGGGGSGSGGGGTAHSVLSYLAVAAVPVWNDALTAVKDPLLVSQLPKPCQEWAVTCKSYSLMMAARAEFHQSVHCRQQREIGMELARLATAHEACRACQEFLHSLPPAQSEMRMSKEIDALLRFVSDRNEQATRDNRTTYREDVPKPPLPPIPPKLLAKSDLPMPETMTKTKVQLFRGL